ncbi:hypothetical protein OROGR_025158 [Orobanche gracilis]
MRASTHNTDLREKMSTLLSLHQTAQVKPAMATFWHFHLNRWTVLKLSKKSGLRIILFTSGDQNHLVLAHLFDKPCFLGLLALKDYYERALTNGVLGIQRGREPGVMILMLPLQSLEGIMGGEQSLILFVVVMGQGIESFPKLGDSIYFGSTGSTPRG